MHARHPSSDGHPVGAPAASARSRGWEFSSHESGTQEATLLALAARCNLEGANRPGGSRARRNPACAANIVSQDNRIETPGTQVSAAITPFAATSPGRSRPDTHRLQSRRRARPTARDRSADASSQRDADRTSCETLSGMIRRYAYTYSEGQTAHWLLLARMSPPRFQHHESHWCGIVAVHDPLRDGSRGHAADSCRRKGDQIDRAPYRSIAQCGCKANTTAAWAMKQEDGISGMNGCCAEPQRLCR